MNTSKIIKGVVGGGRYTVTAPIIKEDYGLYLQIEGIELPETYEVDFSNDEHSGSSVTMIGNSDGVLIPSQFISSGKDVFAFLYHVGDNYGRTVFKFRIPNKLRPDRTDETPTPEEQSTIDQAINALNTAVAKTAQDVIDADASAQSASDDADRAEEAKTDAQNFATQAEQATDDAQTYANNASASATASANSASQSAQIKADVEDLVDDAQGYAQASAQSASASANSASQAQGYAQSASASASSAQGYANTASTKAQDASGYAQTASTKASEASQSAQTASQKATESAQSASQALTYKTDAESAKTASQTAQGFAEQAKADAITAKNDAESARDEAQSIVDGISGKVEQIDSNTERIESLEDDRYKPYVVNSASGSIASFPDGADDIPLKSLIVNIDPVQDLSQGDPSPENICPINGWTEVDVYDDPMYGGNIEWNQLMKLTTSTMTANGLTYTNNNDGSFNMSGTASVRTNFMLDRIQDNYIVPNHIYALFGCPQGGSNSTFAFGIGGLTIELGKGRIWTNPNYSRGYPSFTVFANQTIDFQNVRPQIFDLTQMFGAGNEPSTVEEFRALFPNDYYPYNAGEKTTVSAVNEKPYTHVTIDLGQTVYGGKLDVLSGELVIDRAMVDLGTLEWTRLASGDNYVFYTTDISKARNFNFLCSQYANSNKVRQYMPDKTCGNTNTTMNTFCIRDDAYTENDVFKSAMIGVQLCYELATPITIQLTPNQVNSLLGVNNIWADSGDTTAEYRADTKLFIERLTAPDSADMIADANITSGQYFMVGNSLYKATANIANGSAIVVGTNCIRKSLSEALNEINA